MKHTDWIAEQVDRASIQALINGYTTRINNLEVERLRELFTSEGRLIIEGVSQFDLRPGERAPLGLPPEPVVGRTQDVHQCIVNIEKDHAYGEVYATAYALVEGADGRRMLVRGIRYFDHYLRTGHGWRIEERHHHVHWMFEAPTTIALTQAERPMFSDFLESQRQRHGA
jgi:hypothetical protein